MNKGQLLQAYSLLSQASLEKCEIKERLAIIGLLRKVRSEAEGLQSFIDDVREKNQDIIGSNDRSLADKVKELNKAIEDESKKDVESKDFRVLDEKAIEHLIESNNKWTALGIMAVQDVFGKE